MTVHGRVQVVAPDVSRGGPCIGGWPLNALMMLGLGLCGLVLTAYLSLVSLGLVRLVGCPSGSCTRLVMETAWARFLGLPVAMLAVPLYIAVLAILPGTHPRRPWRQRRAAWAALIALSAALAFAAMWFIGLMLFHVQRSCGYCAAVHAVGVLLLHVVLGAAPIGRTDDPRLMPRLGWKHVLTLVTIAAIAVALLALGQVVMPTAPSETL